jgi:hypothetical protein
VAVAIDVTSRFIEGLAPPEARPDQGPPER